MHAHIGKLMCVVQSHQNEKRLSRTAVGTETVEQRTSLLREVTWRKAAGVWNKRKLWGHKDLKIPRQNPSLHKLTYSTNFKKE